MPKRAKPQPPLGPCTSLCLYSRLPPCPCSTLQATDPRRLPPSALRAEGPPAPVSLPAVLHVRFPSPFRPQTWAPAASPHPASPGAWGPHLALLLPHDVFVLVPPVRIFQLLLLLGIRGRLGLSPPRPGRCRLGVLALELLGHPSAGCEMRAGNSESRASTVHSLTLTPVQP